MCSSKYLCILKYSKTFQYPRTRHKTSNTNTFRSIPYLQNTEPSSTNTFRTSQYLRTRKWFWFPEPGSWKTLQNLRFLQKPRQTHSNQVLQKNPNLLSAALPKFAQPSWQAENGTCSYSCWGQSVQFDPNFPGLQKVQGGTPELMPWIKHATARRGEMRQ